MVSADTLSFPPIGPFEYPFLSIQESNVMRQVQHRFGVESQAQNTALVFDDHTNLVPASGMMAKQKRTKTGSEPVQRGQYPNGLADAMKAKPEITQAHLAREIGTSQQQIGKLLHGTREMTALWAERIAPVLLCSPEQLVFPSLRNLRIPVLSWVSAGRLFAQEGVRKSDVRSYILASGLPRGDWIVLQVSGDSMNRIAPDGAHIFVNRSDQRLFTDKFYVFSDPEGAATFKRYREGRPPRLQPFSTNPDHETIHMTEGMMTLGRVGRVMTDLQ